MLTNVILGMCAGRWGRNGSSERRIRSPKVAKFRCRRDRGFNLGIPPAGTPKYWSVPRGIWAKKNPIARPIDCYLDCERRRYFAPRTGICSGIGSWRGSRTAPRASPRPSDQNLLAKKYSACLTSNQTRRVFPLRTSWPRNTQHV